ATAPTSARPMLTVSSSGYRRPTLPAPAEYPDIQPRPTRPRRLDPALALTRGRFHFAGRRTKGMGGWPVSLQPPMILGRPAAGRPQGAVGQRPAARPGPLP